MTASATTRVATGHVGLNVTDLARSIDFYRNTLGFEQLAGSTDGDRRFAFLGFNGELQLTLWQQSDTSFSSHTAGLHHLAFLVDDIDRVREVEAGLKRLGVKFGYDGVVAHSEGAPSGGIFFYDPDGIRLEVYAPSGAEGTPVPTGDAPTCGFF